MSTVAVLCVLTSAVGGLVLSVRRVNAQLPIVTLGGILIGVRFEILMGQVKASMLGEGRQGGLYPSREHVT